MLFYPRNKVIVYSSEIDIIYLESAFLLTLFEDVTVMNQTFFERFEEFCITPGIDSGKASSYSRAIQYLCDYLNIYQIDVQTGGILHL